MISFKLFREIENLHALTLDKKMLGVCTCQLRDMFEKTSPSSVLLIYHLEPKPLHSYSPFIGPPEASCSSQIRTARAVAEELGEAAAAQSGVLSWAKVPLDHSERDIQNVVEKQGTRLNVPVDNMCVGDESIPWIDPRKWFQYIVDHGLFHMLAGLPHEEKHLAPQVWTNFWTKYQRLHPNFGVFDMEGLDFSRTVGIYIHGDEGRTLKKSGLMVTSVQSCLGQGFDKKRLKRDVKGNIKPQVNFSGHTYTNRFVNFVMPKTLYDKKPDIYHQALEVFSQSLQSLFADGIKDPFTGEVYRFVVLACKGDLPYLCKAGMLKRAYNTAAKKGDSDKLHGVCHLCLAGFPQFPAEQLSTCNPAWLATVGVRVPWVTAPPFIRFLMHDMSNPAEFFRPDLFHAVHLGFGRSWVASIIHLVLDVLEQTNLDAKWKFLTDHYIQWCRQRKTQAHVSKITGYLMSYDDKTGKQGRWHKGALTTNFCRWILKLLGDIPADNAGYLAMCRKATAKLNAMFTTFYQGGFFLDQNESIYAAQCAMEFLSTYEHLAEIMFSLKRPALFPLYPKLHLMHHMTIQLQESANSFGFAENPMACSCQLDEDVIGRVSRLSRRVSIRLTMLRTIGRYLIGCYSAWKAAGLFQ